MTESYKMLSNRIHFAGIEQTSIIWEERIILARYTYLYKTNTDSTRKLIIVIDLS